MTIVMAVLSALTLSSISAQGEPDDELSGRLGGTYASFVERFGEPVAENAAIGQVFGVEGYGLVSAQFTRLAAPSDDDSPALLITLRSERPEELSATSPDDADWTTDEAVERMTEFAPADAELTELEEASDGSLTATCGSAALEAAFGTLGASGCSIRAVQSEPGRVSFITLSLATADAGDQTATPDKCENAAPWAQGSGERLSAATELLQTLAAMDPDSEDALDQLGELEASFAALAEEQRTSSAPIAAASANFYLIGAFTDYADAMAGVADGLEQQDEAIIEQATNAISDANSKIDRASAEIEALVEACRLEVSTPEASPAPEG